MSDTPQTDIRVWCTADGHLVVDAEHARQLERDLTASAAQVERMRKALTLADELCTAADNAEDDIGGSRSIKTILRELGPAVDAALEGLKP